MRTARPTAALVNADIPNISRGGVGFLSRKRLEVGSYYDTRISLFSREMIDAVLEIVHVEEQEKGYYYGGGIYRHIGFGCGKD